MLVGCPITKLLMIMNECRADLKKYMCSWAANLNSWLKIWRCKQSPMHKPSHIQCDTGNTVRFAERISNQRMLLPSARRKHWIVMHDQVYSSGSTTCATVDGHVGAMSYQTNPLNSTIIC